MGESNNADPLDMPVGSIFDEGNGSVNWLAVDDTLTPFGSAEAETQVDVFDGTTLLDTPQLGLDGVSSLITDLFDGRNVATINIAESNDGVVSRALNITTNAPIMTDSYISSIPDNEANLEVFPGTAQQNISLSVLDNSATVAASTVSGTVKASLTTPALLSAVDNSGVMTTGTVSNESAVPAIHAMSGVAPAPTISFAYSVMARSRMGG